MDGLMLRFAPVVWSRLIHLWLLSGLFCCSQLLLTGCKPEQPLTALPSIELLSAATAFDVQVPDTLWVSVRIRSERALSRAVLRVQRTDGVALLPPQARELLGQDTILVWEIALSDSLLPSGQFQLVFQAVSQGQTASLFVPLRLNAVVRPFLGVMWFAQSGAQSAVYRCDTMGVLAPRVSELGLDLVQGITHPAYRKVWLRGQTSPVLWIYHLDSLLFGPVYSTPSDPGQSPYTFLSSSDQGIYVSRGIGDVLCFLHAGATGGQFSIPSDFVPVFTCRQQEHLLVELRARPPSSIRRIRIYHADFQGLIREFTVAGHVLGAARMASGDWLLLIEQNLSGMGRLWRYSLSNQQLLEESPNAPDFLFRSLLSGRDGFWLGGVSGVWNFRPAAGSQSGVWQRRFPDEISGLYFDERANRLIGWNAEVGFIWNPNTGGRIECQLPDSIRFACPY